MVSFLSTLLLAGAAAAPARAAIAAWLTTIAPQVIFQNETSNQIRYSACNSVGDPKYSPTDGRVFTLSHKPKVGTPLAGVGWWDEKMTITSIFYIDEDGNIANGYFFCNMTSGMFLSQGNWVVSNGAPTPHSNSGLASIVLGSESGYRVYYHDSDGAINELGYTRDDGWKYLGVISHDINSLPALGAAFSGKNNITVVSPRDEQNIGVTRYTKDDTWYRSTLPQTLQGNFTTTETNRSDIAVNQTAPATNLTLSAWDGKTRSIGVSIDSAFTRYVWYIGNDSSLHQVGNQNFTWTQRTNQSDAFWPQADKPNGDLAVAYDFTSSVVRLYYIVKGQLSELKYEDKMWKAWSALAAPPPQATQSAGPSPSSSAAASAESGLSTGAKAGIGVGVSLGAIAVSAIIAVLVLARRRKKQQASEAPPSASAEEGSTTLGPETPLPSYGSPAVARASPGQQEPYGWEKTDPVQTYTDHGQQQVQQLDSNARSELYAPQPLYELPTQTYSHELLAEHPREQPRETKQ